MGAAHEARRERYARRMVDAVTADPNLGPIVSYEAARDTYNAMADAVLAMVETERARDRAAIEGYKQFTDRQRAAIESLRERLGKAQTEADAMRELVDIWERRASEQNEEGGKARHVIGRLQTLLGVGINDTSRWTDDNMNAVYNAVRAMRDSLYEVRLKYSDDRRATSQIIDSLRDELGDTKRELGLIRDAASAENSKLRADNQRREEWIYALQDDVNQWMTRAYNWELKTKRADQMITQLNGELYAHRDENERLTGELERAEDAADGLRAALLVANTTIAKLAYSYPQYYTAGGGEANG